MFYAIFKCSWSISKLDQSLNLIKLGIISSLADDL